MVWKEIDLATGKAKIAKGCDYAKWERLVQDVDEDGSPKLYKWEQTGGGHAAKTGGQDIFVYIPIPTWTSAKQCRVEFKRNWLYVWAPQKLAEHQRVPDDAPPRDALLDFQLYGAVDVEICDWQIERQYDEATLVLEMRKSPEYKWPTLHRVNGLTSEKSRGLALREAMDQGRRKAEATKKAPDAPRSEYDRPAGPPLPPTFGPQNAPNAKPRAAYQKAKPRGPLEPTRPPGSYERGRIIVSKGPNDE